MKFLCDQMFIKLGRWLRLAGYDTDIVEEPLSDAEILARAVAEERILITRDRYFVSLKESPVRIIFLENSRIEECARELKNKYLVNWEKKPFSRCSLCNGVLQEIGKEDLQAVLEVIYKEHERFWRCSKCHHIYWMGSHTDRMIKTLQSWNTKLDQK